MTTIAEIVTRVVDAIMEGKPGQARDKRGRWSRKGGKGGKGGRWVSAGGKRVFIGGTKLGSMMKVSRRSTPEGGYMSTTKLKSGAQKWKDVDWKGRVSKGLQVFGSGSAKVGTKMGGKVVTKRRATTKGQVDAKVKKSIARHKAKASGKKRKGTRP